MTLLEEPTAAPPLDRIEVPDGRLYELIDGKPVEKRVSFNSLRIATHIAMLLKSFAEPKDLGFAATEVSVLGISAGPTATVGRTSFTSAAPSCRRSRPKAS